MDDRSHPTPLPRLLTAQELSKQLGYPLDRIYELARRGEMPVVRLGRAVRFDPGAIRAWLEAGGTAAGAEATA